VIARVEGVCTYVPPPKLTPSNLQPQRQSSLASRPQTNKQRQAARNPSASAGPETASAKRQFHRVASKAIQPEAFFQFSTSRWPSHVSRHKPSSLAPSCATALVGAFLSAALRVGRTWRPDSCEKRPEGALCQLRTRLFCLDLALDSRPTHPASSAGKVCGRPCLHTKPDPPRPQARTGSFSPPSPQPPPPPFPPVEVHLPAGL